jgi:hypothetical protein
MAQFHIYFDPKSLDVLLRMPVDVTRTVRVRDRAFVLIDQETFQHILDIAGITNAATSDQTTLGADWRAK